MLPTSCFWLVLLAASSSCQIVLDLKAQKQTAAQIKAIDRVTGKTFVQRQRHRTAVRLGRRSASVSHQPATDVLNTYTAEVTIGSTSFDLLIDTGSSYTWVGSGDATFKANSASKNQRRDFNAAYGSGSASGDHWKSTLMFGGSSATKMNGQGFGNASESDAFNYADGIVGLGPTDLTRGVVEGVETVPTVMDTLMTQKRLTSKVMSAFFAPNTDGSSAPRGTLVLGGTDKSLYTGSIAYAPQLTSGQAAPYWGAKINSWRYGSKTLATSSQGIVDTGTTLLLLPTNAFNAWLAAIPGASVDSRTGLTLIPRKSYSKMQNLTFNWNGKTFTLIPDAQLMPPALGAAFDSYNPSNAFVAIVASSGTDRYTIGMLALTRFYSVYDWANNRIGLAATSHTYERTAGMPIAKAEDVSSSRKSSSTKRVSTSTKRATTSTRKPTTTSTRKTSTRKTTSTHKTTSSKHKRSVQTMALLQRRRDEH